MPSEALPSVGIALAKTGGWQSPLIFWVIFYLVGGSSRFARRGAIVLTVLGVAVVVAAVVAADPSAWRTRSPPWRRSWPSAS